MAKGSISSTVRAALLVFLCACQDVFAGVLIVNSNASDPAPRAAWDALVRRFEREHPEVRVRLNVYDHESYKKSIRNWLTGMPPDVVFWFAGERMRQLTGPGLLEDVSDLYPPVVRASLHRSAIDLMSVGGRQYGVPYTYYQLGFYARGDLLRAAGMERAPQSWSELLAACGQLRARGIEPIAIGTKDLWPTGAWFDYLDLRLNGFAFHMALMEGRIAYTDPRVRNVFSHWRELIERNCFSAGHASSSWQESQALMYQGKAAMMLIGNYIVANFPGELRGRMEFFRFPEMRSGVGRYEDAPINSLHIPSRARNKDDARKFLRFVLRADVQEALNKRLLQIPVNLEAAAADDRFLEAGQRLLAQAEGLAQFFDRDTSEELATLAMKGFQEFMLNPQRLDAILEAIEQARRRIYPG